MILCAAGDIHGALDRFFADVLAFEAELGVRFDHVLHVGDFGIWPDAQRIDKATRNHDGAGDFPAWYAEQRAVPRPTLFIKFDGESWSRACAARQEEAAALVEMQAPQPTGPSLARRWRSRRGGVLGPRRSLQWPYISLRRKKASSPPSRMACAARLVAALSTEPASNELPRSPLLRIGKRSSASPSTAMLAL